MSCTQEKYCLLIPHYNHHEQLKRFMPLVAEVGLPGLIVDDGSDPLSIAEVSRIVEGYQGFELIQVGRNRGKGSVVMLGIAEAKQRGYTHAVQIDADGQHRASDIEPMIAMSRKSPGALVSGLPIFGDDIPAARLQGRKLSLALLRIETLSSDIKDAMCGFRVYPVEKMLRVVRYVPLPARMQFDLEALVRWIWAGGEVQFMNTKVVYPEQGLSHFRVFRDNAQITLMHTKLVIGMLLLSPVLLYRKLWKLFA
jgi:glycosyltransferase involved in cell wall biosynthesis|tara:strand:- start:2587 stop:3345 length:759 start_codon:yes stop_codon:yes gene_type:complete